MQNRKEYILAQFHRTWNKKYENYCIERIYNRLDNPNLQFITQKMFRKSDGHIALADLYFPQLKLSVEVDEEYHNNEEQKERDNRRAEEILNKIKRLETVLEIEPEILRINAGESQTLETLNAETDRVVSIIQGKIDALGKPLEWKTGKTVEEVISEGFLRANDETAFHSIAEVSHVFGMDCKKLYRCFFRAIKKNDLYRVWCPKLNLKVDGYTPKVDYNNEITPDGQIIYESRKIENEAFVAEMFELKNKGQIRFIFPWYRTELGEYAYVFKGVYVFDEEETRAIGKRVWKRIQEDLDIREYNNG